MEPSDLAGWVLRQRRNGRQPEQRREREYRLYYWKSAFGLSDQVRQDRHALSLDPGLGRIGGDDSCHAGLDGAAIATSDRIVGFPLSWTWSRSTMDGPVATFNVATSGVHTVNVWMREDGFKIDKLVIMTNASYVPSGAGPAESPRQ